MDGGMLRAAAVAAVVAGFGIYAAPASAQTMSRTWVSGSGLDGNPCTQSSPCQTFARALALTAPGGEINCAGAGGFGSVTIAQSVSIVCNNVEAGILAINSSNPSSAIVINGSGIVVTISGLDLDGFNSGVNGVQVINAGSVVLDGLKIRNFTGFGVRFEPSATASLTVKKTLMSGNGTASTTSGGLYVHPAATAAVTIADTQMANNLGDGARFESVSGTFTATVINTVASNNSLSGFRFRGVGSNINATLNGVTLANNPSYGLIGSGSGVAVAVGDTTITGSANGIATSGSASLTTFGDNRIVGNTTNGSFTGSQVKQ